MAHCAVCSLKEGHPGITLDENQTCNLCNLEVADELLENFTYTNRIFEEFTAGGPNLDGEFDCLFMYSGGKDSTYMLDKFVNEYGKRVLAYTFDIPFESEHAADNIRLAKEKIPAHFVLDSDEAGITTMMRDVFNRPAPQKPGKYLDEKLPCVSCRTFFVIRAILHAIRNKIPYIALCADPQQILTMESNVREIVRGFYETFGPELTGRLFGEELEDVLFATDDELPKIVFPFIAMRYDYDPDVMVRELKEKGLYQSSPLETHCTLYPLLNYYSFSNWGCMFYKLNASSHLRAVKKNKNYDRSTYSIKFPRAANLPDIEQRLQDIIFDLAHSDADPRRHEPELVEIFRELHGDDNAARFVARSFLDMRTTATRMGIKLA
ncbi:OzmP [Streptomyces sp. NPDC050619]|uniref:OzmP n=1 Tax=Streptomyces sp. NPDC050619 TaxID=3157214 RepID=UPI003418D2A6